MIGTELKRKRDRAVFRVVGREGSMWVLAPLAAFGPAITASPLEAETLFTVSGDAAEVEPPAAEVAVAGRSATEQVGRERLAAAHVEATAHKPVPGLSPEEAFTAAAETA